MDIRVNRLHHAVLLLVSCYIAHYPMTAIANDSILTSTPITTESSGQGGQVAARSVMRVICPPQNRAGTAFLHKSGKVLTAAHVVAGCKDEDLIMILSNGDQVRVKSKTTDEVRDLALLLPASPITAPALALRASPSITIGTQVTTWGFPTGYNSLVPMLSVGYVSGIDSVRISPNISSKRLVVNAAFNSGNSGGPVLSVEDGTVVGLVSSKLAPLPQITESALAALANQTSGLQYRATRPDGTQAPVSEGQVIYEVLQYLRQQVQLVIGHAVLVDDIRVFLKENGTEP